MNLESLESRQFFSVTVTEGYPGFYEIHGSADDDVIEASLSMNEETLTVNGNTYHNVFYLLVYGHGGNDFIRVTSVDGTGTIGASVAAGAGHDTVVLGVDGGIWAGEGNDSIYLLDSFRGEAYGEDGDDYLYISGLTADATIDGGDGDDYVDCTSNQYGVTVHGGDGNDTILGSQLADQLYGQEGDDVLFGNGGNDTFYCLGGGLDQVYGGDGGGDVAYVDYGYDRTSEVELVYFQYT